MFGNKFQSLVFVGAHSDALPIRKHEPLMAPNFLDHIFCHLGAQVESRYRCEPGDGFLLFLAGSDGGF